jgi:hypothetical protein
VAKMRRFAKSPAVSQGMLADHSGSRRNRHKKPQKTDSKFDPFRTTEVGIFGPGQ